MQLGPRRSSEGYCLFRQFLLFRCELLFSMRPWLGIFTAVLILASSLDAQVNPTLAWRTIRTPHFYFHFTPELEHVARRAATDAESAYVKLSAHLHPPRGPIDVVISDDFDFTNGSATPFPSNRIVIYVNPPVFESSLRFVDDPTELILTHELTHIFQLDRAGGIWKVLQRIFGRSGLLFPNAFQPSWLVEGLAVYYESLLTGSGRIEGSEHRMIARSAAVEHAFPRLDQLSLANPRFPYGSSAYAYGSLFVDYLGRTHGDRAIKTFVESSSRQIIPLLLDPPAKRAFGASFSRAYREWARSLVDTAAPAAAAMPGWRDVTVDGAFAAYPRWLDDSTLVYTGTPGRESYAAYRLQLQTPNAQRPTPNVSRRRLGRRFSRSPNVLLSDGSLLYSQLDFLDPYTLRSDLYVQRASGGTARLTHGARLAIPDARRDGLIVAVQIVPAGTRLALVSADGSVVTPITSGGPDEQWSDPRWSPSGAHIAAIRWTRGGTSEVVVVDTAGRVAQTLIGERAVNATPTWSPDGRYVYFSSDRGGLPDLYRAPFRTAFADTMMVPGVQRVSDATTGLFEPELSPSGRELASVIFRADGYHIGIAPLDSVRGAPAQAIASVAPRAKPQTPEHPAASSAYSPWRTLAPRQWMPFFEPALDTTATRFGAYVSGNDVIGRHSYQALLFVPTDNSGLTGAFGYRNARLGQPVIELSVSQDWTNRGCAALQATGQCAGILRRRIRDATLALSVQRPRVRTFSFFSLGGGVEVRDYATDPVPLRATIDPFYGGTYWFPRVVASTGWSNTQRPPQAVSPEDGVSLSATTRVRWRTEDAQSVTTSVLGVSSGYKSLDLPGFAHHVVALRLAGGMQDNRGTGYFEIGGVSGGTLDLLPGYALGEGRRTFSVRGFDAASMLGIRAFAASVEYRAPFRLPGRGLGTLPLFLDRTSVTFFGDAGSAWCPRTYPAEQPPRFALCTTGDANAGLVRLAPRLIGSAGAELNVSAAILNWDRPFAYRLGFAAPVLGTEHVPGAGKTRAYFTVGSSF
jgi:hypothetical protein